MNGDRHSGQEWANWLRLACALALSILACAAFPGSARAGTTCSVDSEPFFESAYFAHAIFAADSDTEALSSKARLELALSRIRGLPIYTELIASRQRSNLAALVHHWVRLVETYDSQGYEAARRQYQASLIEDGAPRIKAALAEAGCNAELESRPASRAREPQPDKFLDLYRRAGSQQATGDEGGRAVGAYKFLRMDGTGLSPFMLAIFLTPLALVPALFVLDHFENRKSRRYDVAFAATILVNGAASSVIVHNISESGLKFGPHWQVKPGDRLVIILDDMPVAAQVAWERTHVAGISFDRKLAKSEVRNLVRRHASTQMAAAAGSQTA